MHPVTRAVPSIEVGTTSTGDFVSHDHRIGERLERVVQLTEELEAKQQTPKLVFPGELGLDSAKPLLEDGRIEVPLVASLWCFTATPVFGNIGTHVQVENGL